MLKLRSLLGVLALLAIAGGLHSQPKAGDWIELFNGKDTKGWKLRGEKITLTKFVGADGQVIAGAKKTKLDQVESVVDARNQPIKDAKIADVGGKKTAVEAEGKAIKDAKIVKTGGRDAIVDKDGKELKDAKAVSETVANEMGWEALNGELVCTKPHGGNDIYTEQKFTDFELHVEFQAWSNSGVYLQGRYEIQVDNSYGAKPKIIEKDGKMIEVFDSHQCGAIYGLIAPSKNMAKPPKEWQSYDVVFRGARAGADGKVKEKARVTLVWNGEKVIDNAEISGPTGAALDGKTTEPGPLLLQGDHGKVTYKNIKIRPLPEK
jgi:hypothetical protein